MTAMATSASALTVTGRSALGLRLVRPQTGPAVEKGFAAELRAATPPEVAKVTCMDWREGERGGHLLTSAGAIVHPHMLEDLHLVIKAKRFLVLQGHSDCAKSRAECPRLEGESDTQYRARVDERTLLRLWKNAAQLVQDPVVAEALGAGLKFCVAYHDVRTDEIRYFERETQALVRSKIGLPQLLSAGTLRAEGRGEE